LSEEGLVILLHQASHHEAEKNEERPDGKERTVVPRIKEWAGESTDKEQEETLYGTNPGNRRWCMRTKEMGFIKPLVCTEGVDDPPEVMAVNAGLDQ
jgi:hypothetical protein